MLNSFILTILLWSLRDFWAFYCMVASGGHTSPVSCFPKQIKAEVPQAVLRMSMVSLTLCSISQLLAIPDSRKKKIDLMPLMSVKEVSAIFKKSATRG